MMIGIVISTKVRIHSELLSNYKKEPLLTSQISRDLLKMKSLRMIRKMQIPKRIRRTRTKRKRK